MENNNCLDCAKFEKEDVKVDLNWICQSCKINPKNETITCKECAKFNKNSNSFGNSWYCIECKYEIK